LKNIHIYPAFEAAYVINTQTTAYAVIKSDYSQNLFYDNAKLNPWLADISQFSYLNIPLATSIGLQGSSKSARFDLSAGYTRYTNFTLMAPTFGGDSAKSITLNLADTAVGILNGSIVGSYSFGKQFEIETGVLFQSVSSNFSADIPSVPAVTWRIAPSIKLNNFSVVPTLIIRSSVDLLTPKLATLRSEGLYDLSLRVSYNLSRRLSLNFDGYNLLNNRSFQYYGYRRLGTILVLGGSFKF
jgi:hypothetical protein